jgi:hypothetical protein
MTLNAMLARLIAGDSERFVECGFTVYWCPVRREILPFRAVRIEVVTHLCMLPVGRPERIRYDLICPDTGFEFRLRPDAPLRFSKCRPESLEERAALLPDGLLEFAENNAECDHCLSYGSSEDRTYAVFQRIRDANQAMKRPPEPTATRLLLLVGLPFTIVLTIAEAARGSYLALIPGFFGVLLVIALVQHEVRIRNARRTRVMAVVLDSVRGTGASDAEIEVALREARLQRFKIARRLQHALDEPLKSA